MKKQSASINKDTLIGEILSLVPEAAEIMEDYGLSCATCDVSAFEPIGFGVRAHGISEEDLDRLIEKINAIVASKHLQTKNTELSLTLSAKTQILHEATEEKKKDYGLKITVKSRGNGQEPAYKMVFRKNPAKEDKTIVLQGIKFFVDKKSFVLLKGSQIDFIESQFGSGFKIWNPKYINQCACGDKNCTCED